VRARIHRDECACVVSASDVLCNSQKNRFRGAGCFMRCVWMGGNEFLYLMA
jgi:hypothetical protein